MNHTVRKTGPEDRSLKAPKKSIQGDIGGCGGIAAGQGGISGVYRGITVVCGMCQGRLAYGVGRMGGLGRLAV